MGFRVWGVGCRGAGLRGLTCVAESRVGGMGPSAHVVYTLCVWGLGFRVWGLGWRVWGLRSRVWGSGFRVQAPPYEVYGIADRVLG